jgi:hypothetical protein
MHLQIIRYNHTLKEIWDNFVKQAKNSSFLFFRDFCEYHQDRFQDHSVLIVENQKVIAIFLANQIDNIIIAHQGLSYSALSFLPNITFQKAINCWQELLIYYQKQDIEKIIYTPIPSFYHQIPSFEDEYFLQKINASLIKCDINSVIDVRKNFSTQKRRKRSIEKAKKNKIWIAKSENFDFFWEQILAPNLKKRFNLLPVHTLSEIKYLYQKFPKNIQLYAAFSENEMLAGSVIFENQKVAHAQYIAANEMGKTTGAIDLLFSTLFTDIYKDFDYFSFGISTENEGKTINQGLLEWKEGFGARTWLHKSFEILLTRDFQKFH